MREIDYEEALRLTLDGDYLAQAYEGVPCVAQAATNPNLRTGSGLVDVPSALRDEMSALAVDRGTAVTLLALLSGDRLAVLDVRAGGALPERLQKVSLKGGLITLAPTAYDVYGKERLLESALKGRRIWFRRKDLTWEDSSRFEGLVYGGDV